MTAASRGWPPSPGMYAAIDAFPVPVIAVCVGNCVGAGAEIAAGADLRVGGDNLKLAWAGARLGVPVGPARLAPLIGVARAKDLVFTGRRVDAARGRRARACCTAPSPAADAETTALELAGSVAAQSPDGVRVLKQMFRELDGIGAARRLRERAAAALPAARRGPAPRLIKHRSARRARHRRRAPGAAHPAPPRARNPASRRSSRKRQSGS